MKIKFVGYWNTDENIFNFINDIWNIDHKYDDILTYNNDYTHLVVFNKIYQSFNKENTIGIIVEPNWSPNFDKNLPEKCFKLITYQPDKYNGDNLIEYPLLGTHRLYDCVYHGDLIFKKDTTKNILNSKFTKTKKLSIIINYHHDSFGQKNTHPETLYFERENLVKKLISSDIDFDMYGQDWNIKDKRYKGILVNKLNGLKDYEYTLSLENSSIRGNITEKIIDPILCNTIPIYNGHKSIEEFYPNSYEYLDYDGNEIERIKDIINSDKNMNNYDFENSKNKYFNDYNPIKIIKELIES